MVFPVRFSEHLWQASVVGLRKANSGSRATLADEAHYAIRDGRGLEYYTLQPDEMGKRVLEFQRAYLRKVIDTVNDLDNVLYEICNEAGVYSTAWQYHLIKLVKEYESTKPKQHPVGMTFQYPGATNQILYDSPADWISPNPGNDKERYRDAPSSEYHGKVT